MRKRKPLQLSATEPEARPLLTWQQRLLIAIGGISDPVLREKDCRVMVETLVDLRPELHAICEILELTPDTVERREAVKCWEPRLVG